MESRAVDSPVLQRLTRLASVGTVPGALTLLCLLVAAAAYSRGMLELPIRGEESRWARGAEWMLLSGDWIVPRQQGTVFPERPPLGSWLMALASLPRGWVDPVAVRLPSVAAVLLTMVLLYGYGKRLDEPATGVLAAAIYASFGQVLQIGRTGESEAVFTCLLAASLLVWHGCWESQRPAWQAWTAGFALAALAALTKGIQAPVYFIAATGAYLVWTRQIRTLRFVPYLLGLVTFVLIVGAWFIPFVIRTDLRAAHAIWFGLASDRVGTQGLLRHLATYPLETFACLLPWSPLLFQFAYRQVRLEAARRRSSMRTFLLISVAVTYPTMLLATGARGRYYMPLYPLIALLVAHGLTLTKHTRAGWARAGFRLWQGTCAVAIALAALAALIACSGLVPMPVSIDWRPLRMAIGPVVVAALIPLATVFLPAARRLPSTVSPVATACSLMILFGYLWIPLRAQQLQDLTQRVEELRVRHGIHHLASLGPIYHRFAYYYRDPIPELPWPQSRKDVPEELEYFCFDQQGGDTNEKRACGRGRTGHSVPGYLPFRWIEIARIPCDPTPRPHPVRAVVIGKVARDDQGQIVWHDRFPVIDLSEVATDTATSSGKLTPSHRRPALPQNTSPTAGSRPPRETPRLAREPGR